MVLWLLVLPKVGLVLVISVVNGIISAAMLWNCQKYGCGYAGTNCSVIGPEVLTLPYSNFSRHERSSWNLQLYFQFNIIHFYTSRVVELFYLLAQKFCIGLRRKGMKMRRLSANSTVSIFRVDESGCCPDILVQIWRCGGGDCQVVRVALLLWPWCGSPVG